MRLVNDNQEQVTEDQNDPFTVFSFTCLSSFALSTTIFGPFALIILQTKLKGIVFRISSIAASLIAILLLDTSPYLVLVAFAFGSFISDGIEKEKKLFKLTFQSMLFFLILGFCLFFYLFQKTPFTFLPNWQLLCDAVINFLKPALSEVTYVKWDLMREHLLKEGVFWFLSFGFLSFWLSIGFAAHCGFLDSNSVYQPQTLRKVKVHFILPLIFILGFLLEQAVEIRGVTKNLVNGMAILSSSLMILPLTLMLSNLFQRHHFGKLTRSFIYLFSLTVGLSPLIFVSVFYPLISWIKRNKTNEIKILTEEKI